MASRSEQEKSLDLAELINISGSLRMLSHSVLVFLLALQLYKNPQETSHLKTMATNCFEKLKHNFQYVTNCFDKLNILYSKEAWVIELLRATDFSLLKKFIDIIHSILPNYYKEDYIQNDVQTISIELINFVSFDLLQSLNNLVNQVATINNHLTELKSREYSSILEQFDEWNQKIRMVSINSRIVSARLGMAGLVFKPINAELETLCDRSSFSIQELKTLRFSKG